MKGSQAKRQEKYKQIPIIPLTTKNLAQNHKAIYIKQLEKRKKSLIEEGKKRRIQATWSR